MAERYSAEQVQQILVQAMGQQEQDSFSRSQLQEMASDLGILPEALARAEQQASTPTSQPQISHQTLGTGKRWHSPAFRQQLRTYVGVNLFLLLLDFTISGAITWSIYPLLGWGLSLFLMPEQFSICGQKRSCQTKRQKQESASQANC